MLSVDRYTIENGAWGLPQKDPAKFVNAPQPPPGAVEEVVDGIQCWTETPMTDEQKQRVRELMSTQPKRRSPTA
jgi:hypothetical protein